MTKRLRNKIALIASTAGTGVAAARRFAAEGAEVIAISHDADALAIARRELDGVARVVQLDPADERSVTHFFAVLGRKHGRLDVLFLNAGFGALNHAIPLLSEGAAVIVDGSDAAPIMFCASRDSSTILGAELAVGGKA